jgi:hypothetical protein
MSSAIFLLVSSAKAEITYMNCKFIEGWHQKGMKREDVKKMSDLTILMDKEKRRIKVKDRDFEPYDIYKDSMRWSHKWTGWNDDYVLNTINKEIKFNFTAPKKDWSIYGGWVNAYEPVNKGRLGSTQEWRIEKPKRHYY